MMTSRDIQEDAKTKRIGLLLINGFGLISYASIVEQLRGANVLSNARLYEWLHFCIEDFGVSSSGLQVPADHHVGDRIPLDTIIVVAGGNPAEFSHTKTLNWLRRLARQGMRVGAVSGGPFILAHAGLLEGYKFTMHWDHLPAFEEAYPHLKVSKGLYVADRDRITCAGAAATFDMMHFLLSQDHGPQLADAVSEWLIQTHIRGGTGAQRRSIQARFGVTNPRLVKVLEVAERRIENLPSRREFAKIAGTSPRHLDRLFAKHLSISMGRYLQNLRLHQARTLLRQSTLSIIEISITCGFVSSSHFTRAYKAYFGTTPRNDRKWPTLGYTRNNAESE